MPLSKQRDRERKRQSRLESKNVQPKGAQLLESILSKQGIDTKGNVVRPVQPKIPIYNPYVHRPGDRVMVRQGLVETVIPEVDADGNVMSEL